MKIWLRRQQSVLVGYVSKIELDSLFCCLLTYFIVCVYFQISGDILSYNKKITSLHNELLEVNLTVKAYIEESQDRLRSFRLALANKAATKSTQQVVEILSAICKFTLSEIVNRYNL